MIEYFPLVTVFGAAFLIMHLVHNKRTREDSHRIFLGFLSMCGLYALSVFLYFTADTKESAFLFARLALVFIYLAGLLLSFFPVTLRRDLGSLDYAILFLFGLVAIFGWKSIVEDMEVRYWGWNIIYNESVATGYGTLIMAFLLSASYQLHRIHEGLRKVGSPSTGKTQIMLYGFLLYIILGNLLNTLFNLVLDKTPPLYSMVLIVPILMLGASFITENQ